jgi:excisionase family DNA binding protein
LSDRLTTRDIAKRLAIGRAAVYELLESGVIPAIRIGKRWLVTRYAFDRWERSCGVAASKRAQKAWTSSADQGMN